MTGEAIILAGGLGTRLRSVLPDLPKCMAPVNGIPFIDLLIKKLNTKGINHFILSLGYKNEVVIAHLKASFPTLDISYCIEAEPLGTGGAILASLEYVRGKDIFILNGDTWFDVDLSKLSDFHEAVVADCSLALKPMTDFSRYGRVELIPDGRIGGFREKAYCSAGLINGGVYLLRKAALQNGSFPSKFSFEEGYLSACLSTQRIMGQVQDGYFIDIGVPEDYERAGRELGED
jgi:D-glycero-alpha-D-manno-heptose 1-phosphate guanylyltransferase